MHLRPPLLAAAALALIAAGTAAEAQPGRRPGGGMTGARLFVSPAGQVFRPAADGENGRLIETWFHAADADHDGALSLEEFRADFARAFAAFDRDGDGEIEPDEVAHYETLVLPEMASRGGAGLGGGMRGRGGGSRGLGGGRGGAREVAPGRGARMAMMSGAARFGLLPIPHPIMDADADFNRGVTGAEFERAAGQRFLMLDTARTGRLILADLTARRRGPPGEGGRRRPPRPGAD